MNKPKVPKKQSNHMELRKIHAICRNPRDTIKSIQTKSHHKTTDPCHVNFPMACDQHEIRSLSDMKNVWNF